VKVLVTGGAGFIGSNFVSHMLEAYPNCQLVVVDKLTYAGSLLNLQSAMHNPRFAFHNLDICSPKLHDAMRGCDMVVHFAAESHVDRSIENAHAFVRTNVEGTLNVIQAARSNSVIRLVHISTDEVYGSLGTAGQFTEDLPLAPSSPYAASKAASDLMVESYVHTHHLPAIITRCSNNYGPYQFPEKFIPLMISQAIADQSLPVYGTGMNVRNWIYVTDHCRAIDLILHRGRIGEVYNIGGPSEMTNLDVARMILNAIGRDENLLRFVADRPGHDYRYSINCQKLQNELGWKPVWDFASGLEQTISWYLKNTDWLERTVNPEHREFFRQCYLDTNRLPAAGTPS